MTDMKSTSSTRRGFAAMEKETKTAIAQKGDSTPYKNKNQEVEEGSAVSSNRGFAAMDVEKRRQIARRGGSTSRRNRIDWKNQDPIL